MKHGHRWLLGALVVATLAVALALVTTERDVLLAANGVIHVYADAAGANNQATWVDVFTDLQSALDAAALSGDQISVAEGTYIPPMEHEGSGDRYGSFEMKNGVALCGGFDPSVILDSFMLSGDLGTIDVDPLFVYTATSHYDLGRWSPAPGVGTPYIAPSTDVEGKPRLHPQGSPVDIEAYESPLPRAVQTWHVATTGSDVTGDGSEENPFATIQHGIDVAVDGDAVLVHTGTYTENISFEGKNISVGSLFVLTGDEDYISQTVIDGDQNGSVVTFMNGEGPGAILSGLTVVNGYAHEATWPYNDGGGICVVDAAPQLSYLHIISNTAINEGGGVYLGQNQLGEEVARVSNCVISDNWAGSSGGGVRFSSDNSRIAVVESSVITGNQANRGAGVHIYHSGILENCLIANNTSATSAGGVYVDWGSRGAFITNSTIVDNSAPSWGGLDYVIDGATVRNSIIFNNDNGNWQGGSYTYSCTSPLPGGIGNIDADPLFADAGRGDYHLGLGSPCIDAGDNSAPLPIYDFEGDARIMDGDLNGTRIVDMGMDEFGHVVLLPLVCRGY